MADRRSKEGIPTSSKQQVLLSYGMLQGSSSRSGLESFKDHHEVYDLSELERALILNQLGDQEQEQEQDHSGFAERQGFGIRPPTLTIFPSWPMQFEASPKASVESTDTGSGEYKGDPPQVELISANTAQVQEPQQVSDMAGNGTPTETSNEMDRHSKPETNRRGPTSSSEHEASKTLDAKTLRRLAQNREAARKSRLRKKAYVQQLESSRVKLSQIEQDLQRARAQQGLFIGGTALLNDQGHPGAGGLMNVPLSSGAAMFDMEHARWLEEQHRHMSDLRAALQAHLTDNDLRLLLDNCLSHYDEIYRLKSIAAKTDVFHLVSGMWKTPAERCFMWMGGFRPSELLKILIPQLEPLTEQQFLGICNLQQSSQQAEDALSQGLEALQQSLSETIAAGSLSSPSNVANYMGQMAIAMGKLANLESFVRQADNLRQQTMHQLHRLLTTRQAARCLLAIGEYFTRLRALSSLWSARPRERLLIDGSCSPATTTSSHDNNNYFST